MIQMHYSKQTEVISVDVFDTLLFRAVNQPKDLFLVVYKRAYEEGLIGNYIHSEDFLSVRVEAERSYYQQGICPTLEQIYERIPKEVTTNPERLLELEFKTEQEYCFRNDDIYDKLLDEHALGKKLYVVSDMYLSKPRMTALLEYCGVSTDIFRDILVSCDYGVSKENGGLYKVLIERCGIGSEKICHIGDNYNSDVRAADANGIDGHYYSVKDYSDVFLRTEALFESELVPEITSIRKLVSSQIAKANLFPKEKFLQLYGASVLAPFYTSATEWLIDTLEHEGISKVYFLMREGALFKMLFDKAQEDRDSKIESDLFFSSRNSLFLPGQGKVRTEEMKGHFETFKKEIVTVFGVFSLFRIEDRFPDYLDEFRDVRLRDLPIEIYNSLFDYMTTDGMLESINHIIASTCDNCLKYIENSGVDQPSIAVVDLGYKGSASTLLDRLCKYSHLNILYLGKAECARKMQDGHTFAGYYSTCGHGELYLDKVLNAGAPFEALLMRGDGCTISYDETGNPIQTPAKTIPVCQFDDIKQIHEGIFKYQKAYLSVAYRNEVVRNAVAKSDDMFRIIGRSFLYPSVPEVRMLAPILNEENFGTEVARDAFLADITSENDLSKLKSEGKRFWKMGILVYNNPLYYIRSHYILNNQPDEVLLIDMVSDHKELKRVVIVGAGLAGERMLTYCLACGIEVVCFMDNNQHKQGGRVCGYPVMVPGENVENVDAFFVASLKYKKKLIEQFKSLYGKDVY